MEINEEHSCAELIFILKSLIRIRAIRQKKLIINFMGFKKAYDSVDCGTLIAIFREFNNKSVHLIQQTHTVVTHVHIGTTELQYPLCLFDIIDGILYNESFFFTSFFILLHYIILNLNASHHPPVYKKITKILVWNCALHSTSDPVFGCCAHVQDKKLHSR